MDKIISLTKRRGFIYPGSDVYGGLSGTWDYGPLGLALKKNIINLWWEKFIDERDDIYVIDSAIISNPKVWIASGHVQTFVDPLCEDLVTNKRYRTDHIITDAGLDPTGMSMEEMDQLIVDNNLKSPDGNLLGSSQYFNMMFSTNIGATDDSIAYLRPETAQGIFTNYKNILDSFYPNIPFGIAQYGKAFRNEISPRNFVFRSREFEQVEIEYFVNPKSWENEFVRMLDCIYNFLRDLNLPEDSIHEVDVVDRAHYSSKTIDIEYDFPFGRSELLGLAYRSDFDLMNIQKATGKSMIYTDKKTNEKFVPHVIEPSFGIERLLMAVLCSAYYEDVENDRTVLRLPFDLAPIKFAVFPLLKNKPQLVKKAKEIYRQLKNKYRQVMFDDNGSIGKKYRRQDEIGTPYCIVIDFTTLENGTVTIRDRDTMDQHRVDPKTI